MPDFSDYDWDSDKRDSNRIKHGIDFQVARRIFEGPVLEVRSDKFGKDEPRWLAIGIVDGAEITLVYTVRNNLCRIISARRAHKNERKRFHMHVTQGGDPSKE